MKKSLSFLVVAMFAITASAQVTWNAKAGFGVSSCLITGGAEASQAHFVGKIGVGIEYPFSANFSLMPSAEFALKGAKYKYNDQRSWSVSSSAVDETVDLYYFQIPVLGAYRFNLNNHLNLVLKAGPYFAFGIYGKEKTTYDYYSDLDFNNYTESSAFSSEERFELGLDFGVDLEFKRFVVGAEYEIGLTPLIKEDDFSVRNSAFYVTVGYKF